MLFVTLNQQCQSSEGKTVIRHVSFMQHFKKYADHTHQIRGGNMRKSLSYIFYRVSLAGISCR